MKRFSWYELFHSCPYSLRGGSADAPNPMGTTAIERHLLTTLLDLLFGMTILLKPRTVWVRQLADEFRRLIVMTDNSRQSEGEQWLELFVTFCVKVKSKGWFLVTRTCGFTDHNRYGIVNSWIIIQNWSKEFYANHQISDQACKTNARTP